MNADAAAAVEAVPQPLTRFLPDSQRTAAAAAAIASPATDPRIQLPRAASFFAALVVPLVLLTARGEIGEGFFYRDIVALVVAFAVTTLAVQAVPWGRLPARALWLIVGLDVVFVASLSTITGGASSPYFALYAPVLAIAGWYLVPAETAVVILLIVATEGWRAVVLDPSGNLDQVSIGLPFFALLAGLASLSARRLKTALAVLRRDQVRTALVLDAVGEIGTDPTSDVIADLQRVAGRVFEGSAVVLPLGIGDRELLGAPRVDGGYVRVPIVGSGAAHGLLQLWRPSPFSATEVRLAALLGEVAGRAADAKVARG